MQDIFFPTHYRAATGNEESAQAGQAKGGEGFSKNDIDLNTQLVKNKSATFFMRVNSDAMREAGISRGDVIIVDRSIEGKNGKVIIALLDGEFLIRKLEVSNYKKRLVPATKNLSPIEISEFSSFLVWGVVTFVIHNMGDD